MPKEKRKNGRQNVRYRIPGRARIAVGDMREALATAREDVDAIVTDPPYGLQFMGKGWDRGVPGVEFWEACLRALKPGGHLVAFGGTRTHHRLWCAVEDAGFEVRDCLIWLYGSGFPKSLDVSKAIDKGEGHWRGRAGKILPDAKRSLGQHYEHNPKGRAVADAARQWDGWGTALKPAWEPILLARKPLGGSVAENVREWGTGGLNIDAARIDLAGGPPIARVTGKGTLAGTAEGWDRPWKSDSDAVARRQERADVAVDKANALGRWPANVVLDEEAAEMLDEQAGIRPPHSSRRGRKGGNSGALGEFAGSTAEAEGVWPTDPGGGPSRFFFTAKAARFERDRGVDTSVWFDPQDDGDGSVSGAEAVGQKPGAAGLKSPRAGAGRTADRVWNAHPTVKPVSLMRWLVRLVTPPGGLVLDPFCGSGSTLVAALQEGMRAVGIDIDEGYCEVAWKRVEATLARSRLDA